MLIGKKCEFRYFEIEYTGIIVEKYNGMLFNYTTSSIDHYIVDIGENIKHIAFTKV